MWAPITGRRAELLAPAHRGTERLQSLDVFRGIAIVGMVLVNNPGLWRPIYAPLQHAEWDGCTPTDLIFPFFLFIVGVAIALSFAAHGGRGESRRRLFRKVVRRTLILFALGIVVNGFPGFDWSEIRIPGVLQRIALCYLLASIAVLTMDLRGQVATTVVLVIGYWVAMKLVPWPGHRTGMLKPGRNLAAYIDHALMHGHLLRPRWDPEGLLTTLPATATTLAGVLTGRWLRAARAPLMRVAGVLAAGTLCTALGLLMDRWFPINKNLWSSSYVVFTAGVALNCFAVCYWLVDIRRYRRSTMPFAIYGANAILAYLLSTLLAKVLILWKVARPDGSPVSVRRYLVEVVLVPFMSPINASLAYAVVYVLFWLGILTVLHRRKIFFKI
ncbi:MAG: heparan-alpha-glucosaminide N-acetyltransferase domain-containing protein [Candidatus Binatia bacterium]